jgi:alkylated DNA repair dioxygenase AlkB
MGHEQPRLFDEPPPTPALPEGFFLRNDFLTATDEAALVRRLEALTFKPFEFHGFLGKRRVAYFGWRYGFGDGGLQPTEPMPEFLLPLRKAAAAFAGVEAEALPHVLITEYAPGAGIGWHRDRPEFGTVIGVSLLSPCLFRLRRRAGSTWRRLSLNLAPRSAYVLSGEARTTWQHSIPGVDSLRYSLTFRTLSAGRGDPP